MIYNEEFETLPCEVFEALQLKRIKQVVQRVYSVDPHKLTPEALVTEEHILL